MSLKSLACWALVVIAFGLAGLQIDVWLGTVNTQWMMIMRFVDVAFYVTVGAVMGRSSVRREIIMTEKDGELTIRLSQPLELQESAVLGRLMSLLYGPNQFGLNDYRINADKTQYWYRGDARRLEGFKEAVEARLWEESDFLAGRESEELYVGATVGQVLTRLRAHPELLTSLLAKITSIEVTPATVKV